MNINERLADLVNTKSNSKRDFALKVGIEQVTFNRYMNGRVPSYEALEAILIAFPDISAEWLLRGEGEMLKSSLSAQSDLSDSSLVEDLKAEINQLKGENRILREQLGLGERKDANKSA